MTIIAEAGTSQEVAEVHGREIVRGQPVTSGAAVGRRDSAAMEAINNWLDPDKLARIQKAAEIFVSSDMVPSHYRGKQNTSNCIIALQLAFRFRVDPFLFLQSSYVVHGRPGIEAKLATALANRSGEFDGPIRYEWSEHKPKSPEWTCTAWAIDRETGDRLSYPLRWQTVAAEGWAKPKSKWDTMPDMMMMYRSAMYLLRTYKSHILLGMLTDDELDDIQVVEGERTGVEMPRAIEAPTERRSLPPPIGLPATSKAPTSPKPTPAPGTSKDNEGAVRPSSSKAKPGKSRPASRPSAPAPSAASSPQDARSEVNGRLFDLKSSWEAFGYVAKQMFGHDDFARLTRPQARAITDNLQAAAQEAQDPGDEDLNF